MAKRKIKKVKDRKNNVKRKKEGRIGNIIIGSIIIFLMVMSIAGISVYDNKSNNDLSFGKYQFTIKDDQLAYTKLNGKEIGFRALPQQTYDIAFDSKINDLLRNAQYIGIVFNPNIAEQQSLQIVEIARYELTNSLTNVFSGVTEDNEVYANLPVLNCDNATQQIPFIYFTEPDLNSNQSSISLEGNCVVVRGDYRGTLIAKDRLVYEYYDVFNTAGENE